MRLQGATNQSSQEVTSVSHQNEQDEKSVASTGSQMMKGRTSFDTEVSDLFWTTADERIVHFIRILTPPITQQTGWIMGYSH